MKEHTMNIREAAARLVVERLLLGGAFFPLDTILRLSLREAQKLGLDELDLYCAVRERFCAQTEIGRLALEMWKDTRNHDIIRGCGIDVQRLCEGAESREDLLPGGALHAECSRLIKAAKAAARADVRSILRGD